MKWGGGGAAAVRRIARRWTGSRERVFPSAVAGADWWRGTEEGDVAHLSHDFVQVVYVKFENIFG